MFFSGIKTLQDFLRSHLRDARFTKTRARRVQFPASEPPAASFFAWQAFAKEEKKIVKKSDELKAESLRSLSSFSKVTAKPSDVAADRKTEFRRGDRSLRLPAYRLTSAARSQHLISRSKGDVC